MSYDEELRDLLKCAEERFGPRVGNYPLPVVTYHAGPAQVYFSAGSRIQIRLPRTYEFDYLRAYSSLAHESVHLLSPVVRRAITTLEEGIAVVFARDILRSHFDFQFPPPTDVRYATASALAERFLTLRPDAILRLRVQEPVISRITTQLIQRTYPEVPMSLCLPLVTPFYGLSTPEDGGINT